MAPRLSVIVPFYNSKSTLERLLVSFCEQTAKDIEYILVNDGSTDESLSVIDRFIKLHPDFKPRHKLLSYEFQRGASEAFNTGLACAEGEYICKCDSDDMVSADYYAYMLDCAYRTGANVVWSPITLHKGNRKKYLRPRKHISSLNDIPIDTVHFSMCNKLVQHKILIDHDIQAYPHIDRWEDLGIMARVLATDPSIAYISEAGYHYYLNPGEVSLSRSRNDVLLRDHLMCAMLLEQWFAKHGLDEKYAKFLHHLKFLSKVKMLRGNNKNIQRWKTTFPESNSGIMHLRHINPFHRIIFALLTKLPTGFSQWVADKIK